MASIEPQIFTRFIDQKALRELGPEKIYALHNEKNFNTQEQTTISAPHFKVQIKPDGSLTVNAN